MRARPVDLGEREAAVIDAYVKGVPMAYLTLRPPADRVACVQCRTLKERADRFLGGEESSWEGIAVLRDMRAHRKLGHLDHPARPLPP
jgi:hypothetical protein